MSGRETVDPAPNVRATGRGRRGGGLANDQIDLRYQPVVDLLTSSVVGLEAHVGWRRPTGEPLQGAALSLFAESYGLVERLGDLTARGVVADLARGRQRGLHPAVTLPVSTWQITASGFADWLLEQLAAARVPARRLTVELSVSSLAAHPSTTRAALWVLRTAGVGVQLSELGSDAGSELLLRVAPITGIKVDRFLITQLANSVEAERTVASILATAQSLSLDMVVAGVETTEQLHVLRRLGCPRATGPLWSPPRPFDEALRITGVPRPRTVT